MKSYMEPSNVCANDRVTKGIKGDIEEEEDNDEDNNNDDDDIVLVFLASIALSMASTAR